MDFATKIRLLLLGGILANLVPVALMAVAVTTKSSHWTELAIAAVVILNFIYFKHLWRVLQYEVLEPMQRLRRLKGEAEVTANSRLIDLEQQLTASFKELSQRERLIADYASDIICSLDEHLKISAVNPAVYHQWGYAPGGLTGKEILRFIYPDDVASLQRELFIAREKGNGSCEARLVSAEGELVDLDCQIEWSETSKTYFCAMKNITDRKNLERTKSEFNAMISHDLRSPLSSVKITIDVLTERLSSQDGPEARMLLSAGRSVNRVLGLVGQLLDIERAEAGALELNLTEVRIDALFADVLLAVEPLAQQKGTPLEVRSSSATVVGDHDRLVQVLINLVSNSVKFTDAGKGIRLYVSEAPDHITITVADQGRGIPKAKQKAIFDRFQQVYSSDANKGTGLGLPICKTLVELHGSKLSIVSEEGQGSFFSFKLPRAEASQ